jgi:hypothetical protein
MSYSKTETMRVDDLDNIIMPRTRPLHQKLRSRIETNADATRTGNLSRVHERPSYRMGRLFRPIRSTCTHFWISLNEWTMSSRNKDINILVSCERRPARPDQPGKCSIPMIGSDIFDEFFALESPNQDLGGLQRGMKIINDNVEVVRFNYKYAPIKQQVRDLTVSSSSAFGGRGDIRCINKTPDAPQGRVFRASASDPRRPTVSDFRFRYFEGSV